MAGYKLKGHEKFHLREGWLGKGLHAVSENPKVFSGKNGTDLLGVGSNMVKSIRYWMQAFELITENVKSGSKLTDFGQTVLQYDEYLEDSFTLWMLHSKIANNATKATVWYLFFHNCNLQEFNKEELFDVLKRELGIYAQTDTFSESSLRDDIDVLLQMYGRTGKGEDPEDKNHSPLAHLDLIKTEQEGYVRRSPDFRKFPDQVLLYELSGMLNEQESISIEKVAAYMRSIYHLNKITTNAILDRLDASEYIRVNRTAGLDVIYPVKTGTQDEIIRSYYEKQ